MKLFHPFDPSITLSDMLADKEIDHLYVFNYMVDVAYMEMLLISHTVSNIHIIAQKVDEKLNNRYKYIKPHLPYKYGTHHTKMFITFTKNECAVIIHTANIIKRDWKYKTQGYNVFKGTLGSYDSQFKSDIIDYVDQYGNLNDLSDLLRLFHFNTDAQLIASVPGRFKSSKYGLSRIKSLFSGLSFDDLIIQCSSIPRLGHSLIKSPIYALMSAFNCNDYKFVYPTKKCILNSYEGISAGDSFPHSISNYRIHFRWLKPHLYHWKTDSADYDKCMPHIKSFAVIRHGRVEFTIVSSHNISAAAWGILKNDEITIKSYELGVLQVGNDVPYSLPLQKYTENDEVWVSVLN
eukprot:NODE_68_length_23780_cov_0.251003.p5 type:complete len:349 gc:universal NODE_68_length_23780_cov_0.251003:18742-19788(+)